MACNEKMCRVECIDIVDCIVNILFCSIICILHAYFYTCYSITKISLHVIFYCIAMNYHEFSDQKSI